MRKIIVSVLYVMLLIVIFSAPVYANPANGGENRPSLDRYQMNQIGGSEALLLFYGVRLPTPEITVNERLRTLEIVFRDSLNKIKGSNPNDFSVISNIEFQQRDNDAVVVIKSSEEDLQVKELRGAGPSDRFTVMITTQRQQERIEAEVRLTQTRLPPVPLIPEFQRTTPVTLDVRDLPLTDVIRLLAATTGKNVVIDKSLPNEYVTMTLRQVPLNAAVEHLKRLYDVDFAMMGENTILAGTAGGLARMTGREATRSFHIAYADIEKIKDLLAGVMGLSENEQEKIVVDERLRRLYITSSPEKLEEIGVVLQSLDNPGRQVMLHARIFEFNNNYAKEVEGVINAIYDNWWFTFNRESGGSIGAISDWGTRPVGVTAVPNLVAPVPEAIDGTWRFIDAAFRVSEERKIGKILANPSVITYDGQEAKIRLTQERAYRVAQANTTIGGNLLYTTEFKEAGPTMSMTPMIGRDGVITIKLNLEASEFISAATDAEPEVSKRQVETNVRVRNGEPFVVGGLHSEVDLKTRIKVPVLGDIPLLGALFRYTNNDQRRTQAVMLVVPYILDTPDTGIEGASLLFRR